MIEVFLEAAAGSRVKGRYDERSLERVGERRLLLPYPCAYGFVLGTSGPDGEALDCFVLGAGDAAEGARVACEPFTLLEFVEDGEEDHKLVALAPGAREPEPEALRLTLAAFMTVVFAAWPEVVVRVGRLLPREAAAARLEAAREAARAATREGSQRRSPGPPG